MRVRICGVWCIYVCVVCVCICGVISQGRKELDHRGGDLGSHSGDTRSVISAFLCVSVPCSWLCLLTVGYLRDDSLLLHDHTVAF